MERVGTNMNKFDYDLNIFRQEKYLGLDADGFELYGFAGPWYIHVYVVDSYQGATMHRELGDPIELTEAEANALRLGADYFNYDDSWYGHEGFLRDYGHLLSERLLKLLDLPVYAEEVLF